MSDIRIDVAEMLGDKLGLCDARHAILEYPSLHSFWDGSLGRTAETPIFREFVLSLFLPKEEARRVRRGVRAVRVFFKRLSRAHHQATGEHLAVSEDVIEELQRHVVEAMYPSAFEVFMCAKTQPGVKVARALQAMGATEERWRKRS